MSKRGDRVLIVGAGVGGLLTGAFLALRGKQVLILEALDFVGGRFTHIDFEGFAVPTGALHALPGGRSGQLFACLRSVGAEPEIVEPEVPFVAVLDGKAYPLRVGPTLGGRSGLGQFIGRQARSRVLRRLAWATMLGSIGRDSSMAHVFHDARALRLVDHLTRFANGVAAAEASWTDIFRSLRAQSFGGEAYLAKGNRAMVESVAARAVDHRAEVRTRTRVAAISVRDGRATGAVTSDGEVLEADLVISNAGAARTAALLGAATPRAMSDKVSAAIPAHGVTHAVRCRRQMIEHASIDLPLDLNHIAGIVPISNLCPALAPESWSFCLAYQVLDRAQPADAQVEAGQAELREYLGADVDVFNSAVYRGRHPAAFLAQRMGQHGRQRFPAQVPGIDSLYMVGHDVQGYGIAAEIIGDACRKLWRRLA